MKGIILAGGKSSRLYPASNAICKQLLPVYDKPLIYYPLTTLMLAGIREILIITNPEEEILFRNLLGDGAQWGIELFYTTQEKPRGIADAFNVGKRFIANEPVCLILGDNILYGDGLSESLQQVTQKKVGANVFGYYVKDPERYGVVDFDTDGQVLDIIEKPKTPPSNYAVIGLYFYDQNVCELTSTLKPSERGELEITDLNRLYLEQNLLNVTKLSRGTAWLDTGTHDSLLDAANFISVLERRQGLKIGSPEEVSWRMGHISDTELMELSLPLLKSGYGKYLQGLVQRDH